MHPGLKMIKFAAKRREAIGTAAGGAGGLLAGTTGAYGVNKGVIDPYVARMQDLVRGGGWETAERVSGRSGASLIPRLAEISSIIRKIRLVKGLTIGGVAASGLGGALVGHHVAKKQENENGNNA